VLAPCKIFTFGVLYKAEIFSSGQWPLASKVLGQFVWLFNSTVYRASTWAHAPSDPVTVFYFWARSHRREKHRLALSSQHVSALLPLNQYLRNSMLGNFGQFTRKPKYILLLPTTSNRHKSALLEWNNISLLGQPTRYKYYANEPQCCVICTLHILLFRKIVEPYAKQWILCTQTIRRLKFPPTPSQYWSNLKWVAYDHVRNEEVLLLRVKKQRNITHEIRKRRANWIGHILRRNCLLQRVIEGKIQGGGGI
jgi:hypothetical protein